MHGSLGRAFAVWGGLALAACGGPIGDGDGRVDDAEIPQAGWFAEIVGEHHGVAGTAVLVDDRTLDIEGFSYDGGGLDARVYVLPDGADISAAFETDSGNLVGQVFEGETLRLTLPEDADPSAFNAITLWCVTAAVSFGHGVFEAP